nr:ATP-binding protein [uncultured Holophaga sp.]
MQRRSEDPEHWDQLRRKILGLGEESIHKSHFAELQLREQQLEASERLFALAFSASPSIMSISSMTTGEIMEANAAWHESLGWTPEEIIGRSAVNLGLWADPQARVDMVRQLQEQGSIHLAEMVFRHKSGSQVHLLGSLARIEVLGQTSILLMATDVTERIKAEQEREHLRSQLIQAQKMDAIGQLAGGVAHDFNNLLTIINLNAEMLASIQDPPAHELEEILLAARRAQDLTRQLLTFGRKQKLVPQLCELGEVVSETAKMLQRIIGEQITLEINLTRDPTPVVVDQGQISQVMMNLAINARDAMPQGGRLQIRTWRDRIEEHHQRARHQSIEPGSYAVLSVGDNGCGMDETTLSHIFEPFFTTKEKGKGTGLGLATVYGIVRQSGGHIWVYSEPGQGTLFKIYIPLAEEAPAVQPCNPVPAPSRGSETILVVEDDSIVRTLVKSALSGWGYRALEAPDPLAALETMRTFEGTIALLVTDMIMPHMNGVELADRMIEANPHLKVLFISGYTDGMVIDVSEHPERTGFLQKPFNMKDLSRKVRELLDAPPAMLEP